MKPEELKKRNIDREFIFTASRSSGPGGQNVNKVSTKVELRFNLTLTSILSADEKELIFQKLKNRINNNGDFIVVSQSESSQSANKLNAIEKFYNALAKALSIPKKRWSTRKTPSSEIKRLENKRIRGSKKRLRKDSGEITD